MVSQLIEEAVVNLIRLGKDNRISVTDRDLGIQMVASVADNRDTNISNSRTGLGTIHLDTFSENWTLKKVDGQTTVEFAVGRGVQK